MLMTYIHQDLTNQKNTQVIDTVYVLRDVQRCSHVFVVCVALCRHGSEQFAKDVKKRTVISTALIENIFR